MSEFAALCADLGRTFTEEELAATLASLDEDGDGELSYEEFKWWCAYTLSPSRTLTPPFTLILVLTFTLTEYGEPYP